MNNEMKMTEFPNSASMNSMEFAKNCPTLSNLVIGADDRMATALLMSTVERRFGRVDWRVVAVGGRTQTGTIPASRQPKNAAIRSIEGWKTSTMWSPVFRRDLSVRRAATFSERLKTKFCLLN